MSNPYKVFHSTHDELRENIHVVLVHPEVGGNVGSTVRAMANMGIRGSLRIVGDRSIINDECRALAKNAAHRLEEIKYYPDLKSAFEEAPSALKLASTARIGSASRPHPLHVRDGVERALKRLILGEKAQLFLVFGPERSGLTNEDVELCDWVVTIPSSDEYRSLNLSQAVLVFCYEVNMVLVRAWESFASDKPTQKEKMVSHLLQLAEEVGFILPGDPYKMRPRLESILNALPNHIPESKTLHGFIDQTVRSVRAGGADFKGRFKGKVSELKSPNPLE